MQAVQQLFTEKYRPKNLSELILPTRVMNKFKDGLPQNMLLDDDGIIVAKNMEPNELEEFLAANL